MSKLNQIKETWHKVYEPICPVVEVIALVIQKIAWFCGKVCDWIIRLRKVFLMIPVAFGAYYLAKMNSEKLPEMVGLNLLETGEFEQMISRDVAVMGPLALTALCLLLMLFSRKTLYPWIISIFSLALPLLILVTNIFPA